MPRLLSEYFAARAQSAGRNCPNAVVEMAMRKETATSSSALIVLKTTLALVIGTGLEDNKPFANVKGIEWRTGLRCSRKRPAFADFSDEKDCFRRDSWATRNLLRRLSSAMSAQFDRSQPVAQPILSTAGGCQQRRLQRPATARL